MKTISPWINFNGNAEEAFDFYKSVFGGEFAKVIRFKDLIGPEFPVAEKDANKIMQIALPIDGANMLMGNDVPEFMGKVSENENRSKIHVAAGSREEAEKIFNGLSAGGQVEAPIGDSPWGTCCGMFRDKYGIEWIVEFNPNSLMFAKRVMEFASGHVVTTAAAHAAGGFGLALLLQYCLTGSAFAPVWIGWVLAACAVAWHLWVWSATKRSN